MSEMKLGGVVTPCRRCTPPFPFCVQSGNHSSELRKLDSIVQFGGLGQNVMDSGPGLIIKIKYVTERLVQTACRKIAIIEGSLIRN